MAESKEGVYVVGTLHGMEPGKPYRSKAGAEVQPYVVLVVMRDQIIKVEYADAGAALAAVGGKEAAKSGSPVSLRVILRSMAIRGNAVLFYSGARVSEAKPAA